MGISLDIRRTAQVPEALSVREHVESLYAGSTGGAPRLPKESGDPVIDRWYIGDEFCANRLPLVETVMESVNGGMDTDAVPALARSLRNTPLFCDRGHMCYFRNEDPMHHLKWVRSEHDQRSVVPPPHP